MEINVLTYFGLMFIVMAIIGLLVSKKEIKEGLRIKVDPKGDFYEQIAHQTLAMFSLMGYIIILLMGVVIAIGSLVFVN